MIRRLVTGLTWFVASVGCVASVGVATADTMPVPKVDYSATRVIEAEQGTIVTKVHASGGKERNEMEMGGMNMITITRPDKKLIWSVMPMADMYMEMDISEQSESQPSGSPPNNVEISKVGSETVDGQEATKYKMLLKDKTAGGFIWINEDGIPIKMDMLSKEGGEKARMKMTLKDLKVGKQDPSLFELPPGLSKMPAMPGMGGMSGMGMGQ